MISNKLRKSAQPICEYIEVIKEYKTDVVKLLQEFHCFEQLCSGDGCQKKYHLMWRQKFQQPLEKIPYTETVCRDLKKYLDFNSVNYRILKAGTCYRWHRDRGGFCLHIPLITNEGCWFVYESVSVHMPSDGSVYAVNNSRPHTFVNAGINARLHITFEIL